MNKITKPLRIAIADDEPDVRQFFRELLPYLGHELVAEAADGRQLADRCRDVHPDLLITDVRMPVLDGISAAEEVNRLGPVPVILVTAHHDPDTLARAGADWVMAYLAKPAKPVDLEAAIQLAMLRFAHFQMLKREAEDLRQALEDRKVIERAKGAIMRRLGVGEDDAFRRLRTSASSRNLKLIEAARQVIAAEAVFADLTQ